MGNYMSCNVISPTMKSNRVARVIFPGGEVKQYRELVKAAELMLECPTYFLVNSRSLNIGRRFSALSADEDLEFGNLYIMFPMKRVNSVVTAADMAIVLMAANSAAKRISGGGNFRISPMVAPTTENVGGSDPSGVEETRSDSPSDDAEGFPGLELKYRLAACRSRKPLLDTILEEPVLSR